MNMILRHKIIGCLTLLLVTVSANFAKGQGVVVSVSGPPDTTHQYNSSLVVGYQLLGVSWIATGAYSNVNIAVSLGGNSGATGRAYLTRSIGTGTAIANQVASASFSFPSTGSFVPMLSGLNLTAGTYYLIIQQTTNGINGNGQWLGTPSPNLSTAANVTANGEYSSYNAIQHYAPATSFSEVFTTYLDYYVTGTPVPEPSVTWLILLGSGVVIWWCRRNRIAC